MFDLEPPAGDPDFVAAPDDPAFAVSWVLKWDRDLGCRLKIERCLRCASDAEASALVVEWIRCWPETDLPSLRDDRVRSRWAVRKSAVMGACGRDRDETNERDIALGLLLMLRRETGRKIRLVK